MAIQDTNDPYEEFFSIQDSASGDPYEEFFSIDSDDGYNQTNNLNIEDYANQFEKDLSRQNQLNNQAEMKKKEMYRQGEIKYDSYGDPINDSNTKIRAKEAANAISAGADWLLEASEGIGDFGQGDWLNNAKFNANLDGKSYDMRNKDILGARDTSLKELKQQYDAAEDDPYSDEAIYTMRKFDGYDENGNIKYIYKNGFTGTTASKRYERNNAFDDGWELVNEKRFAGAEDWEKKWNALSDVLKERTLDYGGVIGSDGKYQSRDEASGIEFGKGKTEILNKDLLGLDTGTYTDYAKNLKESQQLREDEYSGYHDNSIIGRGINTAKGFGSMLTKSLIVDTADWVGELSGMGDIGTEEEKRKFTQNLFGYDDYFSNKNMKNISNHVDDMMENGISWKGVTGALGSAFANVETTGESLGYLAGLMVGFGKFTKVGKGLNRIASMQKSGQINAARAAILTDKVNKGATLGQKAAYQLSDQVGLLNMTTSQTNDDIDAFKLNNNGEGPSGGQLGFMFANNLVALGTDRWTDLNIMKHAGIIKMAKDSMKDIAIDKLPGVAKGILKTSGILATSMGKEFGQEYYQTMSQQFSRQLGTNKYGDNVLEIFADKANQAESLVGGFAGAGGAAHITAAGVVPRTTRALLNKNKNEDTVKPTTESSDPALDVSGIEPATPNTPAEEIYSEIGSKLDNITKPAQKNEAGEYNTDEIIAEIQELNTEFLSPMRSLIAEKENKNEDPSSMPLGTTKAFLNRTKNAIAKASNNKMSKEQRAFVDNAYSEVINFEKYVDEILVKKIDKKSIDEINAMTDDQRIIEFGLELENDPFENINQNTEPAEGIIEQDENVYDNVDNASIERDLKFDAAYNTQNKKTNKRKYAARAQEKAKAKQSIDSIIQDDLFKEDKGLITRVKNLMYSQANQSESKTDIEEVTSFTKNWIAEEKTKALKASGKNTVISADSITQEEIQSFVSKDSTAYDKAGYYTAINNSGMKSIRDLERKEKSGSTVASTLAETISKKLEYKRKKKNYLDYRTKEAIGKVKTMYVDLKQNGIPVSETEAVDMDIDDTNNNESIISNPTHDQIMEAIDVRLGSEIVESSKYDFEINYSDIINNIIHKNNPNHKPAGIYKLLDGIDREISILEGFNYDENTNTLSLSQDNISEVNKVEKEAKDRTNKDVAEATGEDVEMLSQEEIKTQRVELEKTKKRLDEINQDINEGNSTSDATGLNGFQKKTLLKLDELGEISLGLGANLLRSKNELQESKKNNKEISEEINTVEKKIKKLENDRQKLIHVLVSNQERFVKASDMDEKTITSITKAIKNSVGRLVKGMVNVVKEIAKITLQIRESNKIKDELTKKKELSDKIVESKNEEFKDTANDFDDAQLSVHNAFNPKISSYDLVDKASKSKHSKYTFSKLLKNKINKIKDKIERPLLSIAILADQLVRQKNLPKVSKDGIPNIIGSYVAAGKTATSLLSLMTPTSINNPTLNTYRDTAKLFFENDSIDLFLKQKNPLDVLPGEYPFMSILFNKSGKLNESVITAVVLASGEYLKNKASSLHYKNSEELAAMFGLKEHQIKYKHRENFSHRTRRSIMANQIGNIVMQYLDLSMRKDGDIEAFERFKTDAGLLAIQFMIDHNILETSDMRQSEYTKILGIKEGDNKAKNDPDFNSKGDVTFISLKNRKKIPQESLDSLKKDFTEMEKDIIIPKLSTSVHFVKGQTQTPEQIGVHGNPFMNPTKNSADAINNSKEQMHRVNMNAMKYLTDLGRDESLRIMKYRDEQVIRDDKNLTLDAQDAEISANREKEDAYDNLVDLRDSIDNKTYKNKLWFDYFIPNNGRLNINSTQIDPQTEKELHRWIVQAYKHTRKFKIDDIKSTEFESDSFIRAAGFKLGIAQAFGHDIDKTTAKDSIEFADKIMKLSKADRTRIIKGETIKDNDINKGIDHLGHALIAQDAIDSYDAALKTGSDFESSITAEYDGINNGIFLKSMQIPLGDNIAEILFKGGLVLRNVDNSGKNQKGTTYENFDGMLDQIGNGNVLDVYLTQVMNAEMSDDQIKSRIKELMSGKNAEKDKYGLISGDKPLILDYIPRAGEIASEITKELRELFKDPTMTISYGSALSTVIANVANNAKDAMFVKLLTDHYIDIESITDKDLKKEAQRKQKNADTVLNNISKRYEITIDELIESLHAKSNDSIYYKYGRGGEFISNHIVKVFETTLGEAVAGAVQQTFGPMIETTSAINKSSRFMFRIFEQALQHDVDALLEKYGEGENKSLAISQNIMNELIMKNKKFLPIFASPESTDRLVDGIAIFDMKSKSNQNTKYGDNLPMTGWVVMKDGKGIVASTLKNGKKIYKTKTLQARTFVKTIVEAFSSAGVLPTQTEDGTDMAKLVNRFMKDYGITHVHDAIVIGGENINIILQGMNEGVIDTAKGYSMINNIVNAMRSVYEEAKASDIDFTLSDMTNAEEKQNKNYEPESYIVELLKMEDLAEKIWMEKEGLFANDAIIDQVPGVDSKFESLAKYDINSHAEELTTRIMRRALSTGSKKFTDPISINKKVTNILKDATKGIKKGIGNESAETLKIQKSLDIIKSITNVINGEC